ncbi:Hsp20/alpha crystallin family protein [Rhodoferax sp.]|uniref:Hsp20/alpha crystallin family protein n=1 Tax=Rhodoferax sp. TaxID=50421 RepID=UPI0027256771|nr:Hsp20/alpha crystallin family protein [Rhodoferax sp.]MDO9166228.1 Hsp20/alpha crystallin family protein [Rhodoferax sp.]MDO9198086.1 Hsp20/alpha crystallin family protein [Rhodoferax sp.]
MQRRDPREWMLAEAVELLQTADRLQRQFFQIGQVAESPCWEPPVDMYENGRVLGLLIALPGVAPEQFEVTLEQQTIVVRGERALGASFGPGAILRLEIPYGRFERRIDLPEGDYRLVEMQLENGCLRLHLEQLT